MANFKGIIDTTLREGQQSPLLFDTFKYFFSLEEKKQIVKSLINLGVEMIEFFSPAVNEKEASDFKKIKKYLNSITSKKILLLAHCRTKKEDIEISLKFGFNGLNLYMGLSKSARRVYGKSLKEIAQTVWQTIFELRKKYPSLYLRFSAEDAFRTPLKDIFFVYDKIYPYVNTFGFPDTTGMATPEMVKRILKRLKRRYPKANFECHFHNDRGFALINTLEAIKEGCQFADVSILGIGERSGITSLTGLLFNLYHFDKNLVKKYNLHLCYPLNVLLSTILKIQVPWTEPVSLTNRTHIAGVHQHAILKEKITYEAHQLEKFGVTKTQLLLGPLSGWHSIYYYLKEIEGYLISEEKAKTISKEFKKMSSKLKEIKPEELLKKICEKHSLTKIALPQKERERRVEVI
jgi:homocitrate synthase